MQVRTCTVNPWQKFRPCRRRQCETLLRHKYCAPWSAFSFGTTLPKAYTTSRAEASLCPRRTPSLSVKAAATSPTDQKIRIKLKSYKAHLLQESVGLITEAARSTGANAGGPVYLPTRCGSCNSPISVYLLAHEPYLLPFKPAMMGWSC